jgi:hypothetical protein
MHMRVLAIVALLGGPAAALADDVPQSAAPQAEPAAPNGPVKIIDTPAAPVGKADQAQPASPAPPPVSTQSKTKEPDRAADATGNRFSFVRVDDGFLRFDLTTGQVAYCNARAGGWGCQAVPENRSALEREVGKLKDEIAGLKRQVEDLREPPPPRPPAPIPPPPAQGDVTRDAPRHDDIARAKAMLQDVWERLVAAIVGVKNDVMRKS